MRNDKMKEDEYEDDFEDDKKKLSLHNEKLKARK